MSDIWNELFGDNAVILASCECEDEDPCTSTECGSCESSCQTTCESAQCDSCETSCTSSCTSSCTTVCSNDCMVGESCTCSTEGGECTTCENCQTSCETDGGQGGGTTAPGTPDIYNYNAGENYITIFWYYVPYSSYYYAKINRDGGTLYDSYMVADTGSPSYSYTFTGLTAGRSYSVAVSACNSYGCGYDDVMTAYTDDPPVVIPRPDNFTWDTPLNASGEPFNMTAANWLYFQSRINSFREYKGLSRWTFTAPYTGNDLTAAMFIEVAQAIDGMNPPGGVAPECLDTTTYIDAGKDVYRWYFDNLVAALNSIP